MESVMSKFCWSTVLLAVLLCAPGPRAWAKPPDLPADNDIRCREACEPTETWRWLPGREVPTVRPHGAAIRLRDGVDGEIAGDLDPELCEGAQKARELYEAGRRFTRDGDLEQARARLREAHMANPTCHYGQRAIQRLLEMEAIEMGEESERPKPATIRRPLTREHEPLEEQESDDEEMTQAERSFQRVRQSTQPLGMVRMPTY
jgi:hypothetical protein